ncbi:RdgB/HAM1 family non-canonical purine NTP pyrophosphatase [Pseudomarimonas arenosa]|uniref:dITP/XTP pyrophosphatase n=1 Tax=Pseudomarimonas arenosa TaxID=2774145 RepID=A0AAW3ZJY7_9GAMM|nr:RdgB/HAM1 family non-canonical purine NTP pyrophosphatase [Pseudomarimonas arenosa]MBD8525007.1 RdgB/HAM1 family non-canonical purine NTP pyrophosphatase [Pseudomarimonas arenosa]
MPEKLLIATGNAGKLAEFQRLFAPLGVGVVGQGELGIGEIAETGLSFVENALIKARHACQLSGLPSLADDSGLCVDALHGAPGLRSARFAGDGASSQDNIDLLLARLADRPDPERSAHFVCVLVYLRHPEDPDPLIASGRWYGRIMQSRAGAGGFGYDPVFLPDGLSQSAAELPAAEKARLSHRGQAIGQLSRLIGV